MFSLRYLPLDAGNKLGGKGLCDDEGQECGDGDEESQTMCLVNMMIHKFSLFPC